MSSTRDEKALWKEWLDWLSQAHAALEEPAYLFSPPDSAAANSTALQAHLQIERQTSLAERGKKLLGEYLKISRRKQPQE